MRCSRQGVNIERVKWCKYWWKKADEREKKMRSCWETIKHRKSIPLALSIATVTIKHETTRSQTVSTHVHHIDATLAIHIIASLLKTRWKVVDIYERGT